VSVGGVVSDAPSIGRLVSRVEESEGSASIAPSAPPPGAIAFESTEQLGRIRTLMMKKTLDT
jgi:hypothetical protein